MFRKPSIEAIVHPHFSDTEIDLLESRLWIFLSGLYENLGPEGMPHIGRKPNSARKLANHIQRAYGFRPNLKLRGDRDGDDNPGRMHGFNRTVESSKRHHRRVYQQNRQYD